MMRMTRMRAGLWMGLLLLLAVCGPALRAQQPLDRQRIEAWRQAPAYQYGMEPAPRTRRERSLSGNAGELLMQRLPVWAEAIIYGLMGAVLLVLAVVLIRRGWGRAARPVQRVQAPDSPPEAEAVPLADYELLIRQALARQEYRLAIRYTYLAVLQRLDHLRMIEWEPQKTNADYQRELAAAPAAGQFRVLTRIFEYCWYGDAQPGPDHFNRVAELAQALHRDLPAQS